MNLRVTTILLLVFVTTLFRVALSKRQDRRDETICSVRNSTEVYVIDLARVKQGRLQSHPFEATQDLATLTTTSSLAPFVCKWKLELHSDSTAAVQLSFDLLDIPESPVSFFDSDAQEACADNFVKVYQTSDAEEDLLDESNSGASYCGNGKVKSFYGKPGTSLIVEAKITRPFRGFRIQFKAATSTGQQVNAASETNPCKHGYFQCKGSDSPIPMCIPESFKCNGRVDCKGGEDEETCEESRGAVSADSSGCGSQRRFEGSQGTIQSMNYPKAYENNAQCIWYLTAPKGKKISVTFKSKFSIQREGNDANADDCNYDSLTFYTIDSTTGLPVLIARLCGSTVPQPLVLPSNKAIVTFDTNDNTNGAGFKFDWKAVSDDAGDESATRMVSPLKRPDNDDDLAGADFYNILGESGESRAAGLGNDMDGADMFGEPTDTDTEVIERPNTSEQRGSWQQQPQQQMGDPACSANGLVMERPSGVLSTPARVPQNRGVVCTWVIKPTFRPGQKQQMVEFRFYDFSVAQGQDCSQDVLEIIFEDNQRRKRRARYSCGSKMPSFDEAITAETDNPVTIIFHPGAPQNYHRFEFGYIVIAKRATTLPVVPALTTQTCGKSTVVVQKRDVDAILEGGNDNNEEDDSAGETRIVGGMPAKPGAWPWIAELLWNNRHMCGATILNQEWLVTAAHCFRQEVTHNTKGWQIIIGRHAFTDRTAWDKRSQYMQPRIKNIFVHGKYNKGYPPSKEYDIALIQMATPLQLGGIAVPICLPSRPITLRDKCYVMGWGDTKGTGHEGVLKQAVLPVIDLNKCKKMNLMYSSQVKDSMICAGYEAGGIDSCQGDSGGPFVCKKNGDRWELQGVVSFGKGCAGANAPGVYTKVYDYVPWISKVIRLKSAKPTSGSNRF